MTYSELQTRISDFLNRTDLDAVVPDFISLMESQIERTIRVREMLAVTTLTVDGESEAVPDDFLEASVLYLSTNPVTVLQYASPYDLIADRPTGTAKPTRYSVLGSNFTFSPVPDTGYTANLVYFARLPRLSDANPSNWLLDRHEDIYLYGSLLNSAPYLREDPRLAIWGELYSSAVNALNVADDRAKTQSANLVATARTFG